MGRTARGRVWIVADARALAVVWRWLIEKEHADPRSTEWAAAEHIPRFQAHLQWHGYAPPRDRAAGEAEAAARPAPRSRRPRSASSEW